MTIFSGFDQIRIINLPSRPDRRAGMLTELRRLKIDNDPRVEFVNGVSVDDKAPFRSTGEKGVFLAHLKILSEAATAGVSVLILEDDADFRPAAAAWHLSPDCDIAYGGYLANDPSNLETSDIVGAHCMGFSARAAPALVTFLTQLLDLDSPPPIDGAYVWFRRQQGGFKTEFANPVVAVQRPSRSDIAAPRTIDRIRLLRVPVAAARWIKRRLVRKELTFGLREAVILSVVGSAMAFAATYHYNR